MTADLPAALDRIEGLAAEAGKAWWEQVGRYEIPPDEMSDPTWLPRLAAVVRAVLGEADRLGADCAYHEAHESDPAEIRAAGGWVNVDDYVQDIRAAATKAWEDGR